MFFIFNSRRYNIVPQFSIICTQKNMSYIHNFNNNMLNRFLYWQNNIRYIRFATKHHLMCIQYLNKFWTHHPLFCVSLFLHTCKQHIYERHRQKIQYTPENNPQIKQKTNSEMHKFCNKKII